MANTTPFLKYNTLSNDIIFHILQYDKRFIVRNGKLMGRIEDNDYRYETLNSFCQEFIYNPNRSLDNTIIELAITRNKSYIIEMRFVQYIYIDNIEEENDIIRLLLFQRYGCDVQVLCEY